MTYGETPMHLRSSNLPPEQMTAHDGAAVGLPTTEVRLEFPSPGNCATCGARATCQYGWNGLRDTYACAEHDPWRSPWFRVGTTTGFTYMSIPDWSATMSVSHVGRSY